MDLAMSSVLHLVVMSGIVRSSSVPSGGQNRRDAVVVVGCKLKCVGEGCTQALEECFPARFGMEHVPRPRSGDGLKLWS